MKINQSMFESQLTDETLKVRRNSMIMSGICFFIGLTEELPTEITALGMKFNNNQQESFGWFIFILTTYLLIHSLVLILINYAPWLKVVIAKSLEPRELGYILRQSQHCEADIHELLEPPNPAHSTPSELKTYAAENAILQADKKLSVINIAVYMRLVIDILIPFIAGAAGLILLLNLIF